MPRKKINCPTCDGMMKAESLQCQKCKPAYERTAEHKQRMKAATAGKPKPHLKGQKRPAHSHSLKNWWTPERKAEASARGLRFASDPEWIKMIAESVSGERNPMWQGGISGQRYAPGFCKTLKAKIRERDNFICQLCGATEDELGYRLSIHHSDYDKTNHDEDNLFATCKRCNSLVNTNRDIWPGYFAALAKMRRQLGKDVNNLIGRKVITQRKGFIATAHDGGPDLSDLFARFIPDKA